MQRRPTFADLHDDILALRNRGSKAAPVKDAATLVLTQHNNNTLKVLLGKRSGKHTFMPHVYVFPGGRVDDEDHSVRALSELGAECKRRLSVHADFDPTVLALTSIRETFEETGLVIGDAAAPPADIPESWRSFFATGAAPSVRHLRFIGRAVTPPLTSKRFNTRFFQADAQLALYGDPTPRPSDELEHVKWFTLDEAMELSLPGVTRLVLERIACNANEGKDAAPFNKVWNGDQMVVETID